jgi:hypothetical protein
MGETNSEGKDLWMKGRRSGCGWKMHKLDLENVFFHIKNRKNFDRKVLKYNNFFFNKNLK